MITTRTTHVTRTTLAATTAVLAGLALVLTACGGGHDTDGGTVNADGTYISTTEGQYGNVVVIDGNKITYLSLSASDSKMCPMLHKAFEDIDKGEIRAGGDSDDGMYEVESTGIINDAQTMVTWDDDNGVDGSGSEEGTGWISIASDSITLEYVFHNGTDDDLLVPRDSDQGKAVVAKYCG